MILSLVLSVSLLQLVHVLVATSSTVDHSTFSSISASPTVSVSTSPIILTAKGTAVIPEWTSYSYTVEIYNTTTGTPTTIPVVSTQISSSKIIVSTIGASTSLLNQTVYLTTVTSASEITGPPKSTKTTFHTSTVGTTTVALSPTSSAISSIASTGLSSAAKAGIGIAGALGGVALIFLAFCLGFFHSRRRNKQKPTTNIRNLNMWDDIEEPTLEERQVYELLGHELSKSPHTSSAQGSTSTQVTESPISPLSPTAMAELRGTPLFEKLGIPRHEKFGSPRHEKDGKEIGLGEEK